MRTPGSFFRSNGTVAPGKQRVIAFGKWIFLIMESPTINTEGGISGGILDGAVGAIINGVFPAVLGGVADGVLLATFITVACEFSSTFSTG